MRAWSVTPDFELFGTAHVSALTVIFVVCVLVWVLVRQQRPLADRVVGRASVILALALVAHELTNALLHVFAYDYPWQEYLPLHLCRINAYLSAYMLIRRSYPAYEVTYFWAMAASTSALLTPDLREGFPHPLFVTFFLGHGLVVLASLLATWVFGFRPRFQSIAKALLAVIALAAVVAPVNLLLGTNYLYLAGKPTGASVLDYLGPWPWYLGGLLLMGAALFTICYVPFLLLRRRGH